MGGPVAALRAVRYALPGLVERVVPGGGAAQAARLGARIADRGDGVALGLFARGTAPADEIVATYRDLGARLAAAGVRAYFSIKAASVDFAPAPLAAIAAAGRQAGQGIVCDALVPALAEPTHAAVAALLDDYPGTGLVLPARWARSADDAARFRDSTARLRVVKGEWPDPVADAPDCAAAYLALVGRLAGRAAPVAVATHDPDLAARALVLLRAAGTPCELEQLRGLPARRTRAVAAALGVPVRCYAPFGPGWWPYALDKALGRPYLPRWFAADLLGARAAGHAAAALIP